MAAGDTATATFLNDEIPKAMLNVLEDYAAEGDRLKASQRAVQNILEDAEAEKAQMVATQKAVLNILDDANDERARRANVQLAMLNILEDLETEKGKLDTANQSLRREVREHTQAETALAQSRDEFSKSNAELELFAYAASHDLSEPLRAISGPASLLARRYRGQLDPDADELIEFIVDGCRRMQTLIEGLLVYSRVGRVERPPETVDLDAVVRTVLSDLAPVAQEKQASITVEPLPTVQGEREQLGQVFQNLLSNALKFVADRPPEVHVTAERQAADWRVTVTDNGIGIPAEQRERVFVLFKRLHGRQQYPGTGIGLALTRKIVERHGGEIGIADGPDGYGVCFWFTIPDGGGDQP